MASSLIKGLAITLGGGLAVGLGIKIGQSSASTQIPHEAVDFGPVLDRIEGVENRIISVESAHAALTAMTEAGPMVIPTVQELEERVQTHTSEVEALRAAIQRATERHDARIDDLGSAVSNLEARIPELIDQGIKPKFDELHDRVQREMQETASQTLEIFADRIQARVVEKITSIEGDLGRQSEAINDLRDYSLKTDQNLQRLLAGVENLADKINRKFETPIEPPRPITPQRQATLPSAEPPQPGGTSPVQAISQPLSQSAPPAPLPPPVPPKPASLTLVGEPGDGPEIPRKTAVADAGDARPEQEPFEIPIPRTFSASEFASLRPVEPPRGNGFRKAALAGGTVALCAIAFLGVEFSGILPRTTSAHSINTVNASPDTLDAKKLADQSELLDKARAFSQKKEFAKAEEIYKSILSSDPTNTEVKRKLAGVLLREEKIEETTKIVKEITEEEQAKQGAVPQQ